MHDDRATNLRTFDVQLLGEQRDGVGAEDVPHWFKSLRIAPARVERLRQMRKRLDAEHSIDADSFSHFTAVPSSCRCSRNTRRAGGDLRTPRHAEDKVSMSSSHACAIDFSSAPLKALWRHTNPSRSSAAFSFAFRRSVQKSP